MFDLTASGSLKSERRLPMTVTFSFGHPSRSPSHPGCLFSSSAQYVLVPTSRRGSRYCTVPTRPYKIICRIQIEPCFSSHFAFSGLSKPRLGSMSWVLSLTNDYCAACKSLKHKRLTSINWYIFSQHQFRVTGNFGLALRCICLRAAAYQILL
ncbi:hypothetical protein BJV78DRAFT_89556 [Lactifluus subvellereus]|nr:hypothetical protein BJV78DRAFT_89556 [Lactifluus subvellereus]